MGCITSIGRGIRTHPKTSFAIATLIAGAVLAAMGCGWTHGRAHAFHATKGAWEASGITLGSLSLIGAVMAKRFGKPPRDESNIYLVQQDATTDVFHITSPAKPASKVLHTEQQKKDFLLLALKHLKQLEKPIPRFNEGLIQHFTVTLEEGQVTRCEFTPPSEAPIRGDSQLLLFTYTTLLARELGLKHQPQSNVNKRDSNYSLERAFGGTSNSIPSDDLLRETLKNYAVTTES